MKNDVIKKMFQREGASEQVMKSIISLTKGSIYPMVRKIVGDHPSTDDILQTTYITVFEKLDSFQWTASIETWVYRIAMNKALDEVRGRSKRAKRNESISIEEPAESVDFSRVEALLSEAILNLPERQKEVFVLRYFEDFNFIEVAQKTGLSEGGCRSNYHHAKEKVKKYFEAKGLI